MSRGRTSALFEEAYARGAQERTSLRACDAPGCACEGAFRAPRSRDTLSDYYWFCLDHVRAYNAAWDFHAGMSPEEIELSIRDDSVWNRPSWLLGRKAGDAPWARPMRDPFGFTSEGGEAHVGGQEAPPRRAPTPEVARALSVLDLHLPLTRAEVKARYKELVKRHHPDANGGDKRAEERLKLINEAYATLRGAIPPDLATGK